MMKNSLILHLLEKILVDWKKRTTFFNVMIHYIGSW